MLRDNSKFKIISLLHFERVNFEFPKGVKTMSPCRKPVRELSSTPKQFLGIAEAKVNNESGENSGLDL